MDLPESEHGAGMPVLRTAPGTLRKLTGNCLREWEPGQGVKVAVAQPGALVVAVVQAGAAGPDGLGHHFIGVHD